MVSRGQKTPEMPFPAVEAHGDSGHGHGHLHHANKVRLIIHFGWFYLYVQLGIDNDFQFSSSPLIGTVLTGKNSLPRNDGGTYADIHEIGIFPRSVSA